MLKSKYLLFFPARKVFRYARMDVKLVILVKTLFSNMYLKRV